MQTRATFHEIIGSSFGGMCGCLVGYPLDTVKVRMQTLARDPTNSITAFRCAKLILREEGMASFFKGITAPILGAVPVNVSYFMGYYWGKQLFWKENTLKDNDLKRMAAAAGFSGFAVAPVYSVVDRLKCILQVQRAKSIIPGKIFRGPFDLFLYMYRNWGLYGCSRGFWVTILRDVPGSVFYFGTYDWVKGKLAKKGNNRFL